MVHVHFQVAAEIGVGPGPVRLGLLAEEDAAVVVAQPACVAAQADFEGRHGVIRAHQHQVVQEAQARIVQARVGPQRQRPVGQKTIGIKPRRRVGRHRPAAGRHLGDGPRRQLDGLRAQVGDGVVHRHARPGRVEADLQRFAQAVDGIGRTGDAHAVRKRFDPRRPVIGQVGGFGDFRRAPQAVTAVRVVRAVRRVPAHLRNLGKQVALAAGGKQAQQARPGAGHVFQAQGCIFDSLRGGLGGGHAWALSAANAGINARRRMSGLRAQNPSR